jgi:hypothetical protein
MGEAIKLGGFNGRVKRFVLLVQEFPVANRRNGGAPLILTFSLRGKKGLATVL